MTNVDSAVGVPAGLPAAEVAAGVAVPARRPGERFATRLAGAWLLGVAGVLAALLLPGQLGPAGQRATISVLTLAGLVAATGLIARHVGAAGFGHIAFFGLGGYLAAILTTRLHASFWIALPVAVGLVGVVAALLGAGILRLPAHQVAIVGLGLVEALRELVVHLDVTGGRSGLSLAVASGAGRWADTGYLALFAVLAALAVAVAVLLERSRFGPALRAIGADERLAAAAGVNTVQVKTLAFAGSAALVAAIGAAHAHQQRVIFPAEMFDHQLTLVLLGLVLLGGARSVLAPVAGALVVGTGLELLGDRLPAWHPVAVGALLVAVAVLPHGLPAVVRRGPDGRRSSIKDMARRYGV